MPVDVDDLIDEFDEITSEVARSSNQFYASNLRRWFSFLDGDPDVSLIVKRLEGVLHYEDWKEKGLKQEHGAGSGYIHLPEQTEGRLAAYIGLFRSLTVTDDAPWQFAHEYVSTDTHFEDMVRDLTDQLFDPFSTALRRYLRRELSSAADPQNDRTVVTENNDAWQAAIKALEDLRTQIQNANEPDPETRAQLVAELSAGLELMKGGRMRVRALFETAGRALTHTAKTFLNTGIGQSSKLVWDNIIELLTKL